jgi:hypothetical protein
MSIRLEGLVADATSLDLAAFKRAQGDAFLVRSTSDGELELEPLSELRTSPGRRVGTDLLLPILRGREGDDSCALYWVYPLRGRAGEQREITVGRVASADVCIPDKSVSRLHAAFEPMGDGRYRLVDHDSRNGTFVARRQLDAGKAQVVPSGQTVQFGNVVLAFYHAKELVEFIYKLRG